LFRYIYLYLIRGVLWKSCIQIFDLIRETKEQVIDLSEISVKNVLLHCEPRFCQDSTSFGFHNYKTTANLFYYGAIWSLLLSLGGAIRDFRYDDTRW